jgi:hypothetical protein
MVRIDDVVCVRFEMVEQLESIKRCGLSCSNMIRMKSWE